MPVGLETLASFKKVSWHEDHRTRRLHPNVAPSRDSFHQMPHLGRYCRAEPPFGNTSNLHFLRGFWDRGRVCGDRSVFVTSHRPAHSSRAHVFSLDRILHFAFEVFFLFAHLPARCTSMSLDLELAKILDEFAVPEAFRTKLVDSACLKVWQFAEYVDDVKDWTGMLSSLEPPIVDRMHIASVSRAYKAACARDAELLSRGRDYPGEDMDAPI